MSRKLKTMDGNTAAATVSYAFTEVAAIYPITPSSTMAEVTDSMAAAGAKNIFGQTVRVAEMQSEAGAAGAVHGSVTAGALTTTYTASQGLLLMIPNMYKIAGEQTPCVMDVSARCVASHALNIFGDHSDVMACRQTGFAMLCSDTVQECMDLGAVAHLSTIKGKVPFMHFFDGFRTSHEIQKIEVWDNDTLAEMVDWDAIADFRRKALNPEHPDQRGSAQSPEIFFQAREACNPAYDNIVEVTEQYMQAVNEKIGTDYHLFNYYGAEDAEYVIIAMGSINGTIQESVDYLNAHGAKVGLVKCHLYRPFSQKYLVAALPKTVKKISVLDRTKEPGSYGEPLYLDVVAALKGTEFDSVPVYGGRFGLGGKDTTPSHIIPIYENMEAAEPKEHFTIAIHDDVSNLSLPIAPVLDTVLSGLDDTPFLHGGRTPARIRRARAALASVGLAAAEDAAFGALSGGEQRLVLLARAVVKRPPLLVLDEPCQNLDRPNRERFVALVDALCADPATTLLYVTHLADTEPRCITHRLVAGGGPPPA